VHPVRTETGDPAWLVTGWQEVRQLLDDPHLGRSHPDPERAARTGESALFGGPLGEFDTEAADHARMRSLLQPYFTPRRIRALRPRVEALTTALLDELARHGPPADLVEALAVPLPVLVICELLGVPYADRDRFRTWTKDAADIRDRTRSEHGLAELFGYGQQLVARKRAEPGDDVVSRLCATAGIRHTILTWVERNYGFAVAEAYAGHEDNRRGARSMGAMATYAGPACPRWRPPSLPSPENPTRWPSKTQAQAPANTGHDPGPPCSQNRPMIRRCVVKSRAAAAVARGYRDLGLLPLGHAAEVAAADLIDPKPWEATRLVGEAAWLVPGGILMITDAHARYDLPGSWPADGAAHSQVEVGLPSASD
jgi:pentalenolactone synthase